MVKKLILTTAFLFSLSPVFSGEDFQKYPIGPFGGLNDRDSSYAIPAQNAQSLLNVDVTPGGKSVKKRHGYGAAFTLTNSTSPVHGVYDFFDSAGNEVDLFFNDTYVTATTGGSQTVLLSTAPNGATWQCTDSLGIAYCVNSARTGLYKITSNSLSQILTITSTGTMIATAVDRLVMAGFSDAPSRIDFSAAGDFTLWGSGSLGTSPAQFTINAPGAKVTHLDYTFGRAMWFKDTSFGYILIGNQPLQSDWVVKTVAYDVGTNDNTYVYREGILYFRGKDGHIYMFDGYSYQRLSREISGTIGVAQTRASNSWTQTTQSDFGSGSSIPSGFISSNVVSGSLMGSSFTITETSNADFSQGTFSNTLSTGNFVWISTTNSDYFNNRNAWSFENSPFNFWNKNGVGPVQEFVPPIIGINHCGSTSAQDGGHYMGFLLDISTASNFFSYAVVDAETGLDLGTNLISWTDNNCSWTQKTISTTESTMRKRVYLRFNFTDSTAVASGTLTSQNFTWSGQPISFYYFSDAITSGGKFLAIDTVRGGFSYSTGTYTSKSYDTGISTNLVSVSSTAITQNEYSPNITLQTSIDNSSWRSLGSGITSTSTLIGNRYLRYISSFTVTGSSDAYTTLNDVTLVARATGTYYSAVNNAPSLTSWDTFGSNYQNNDGTIQFYVRSATGPFSVLSSTPAWTLITPGAIPSISTNPYFQMASSFSITAATQNPTINDFTFNWFEGNAADKSYATYFDDKIMFSAPIGTGTTVNNRVLIYDMLNQGWFLYDLPVNGFYVRQNKLYFGSSLAGKIFKYGEVENDNGSAINSYWKSKDFFGTDPFATDEIANLSVALKTVSNSTGTVTYIVNGSSTSSYNIPLSNSNTFFTKNKNLPAGTNLNSSFNFQFGNNAADQTWEMYGVQLGLRPKSWTPN